MKTALQNLREKVEQGYRINDVLLEETREKLEDTRLGWLVKTMLDNVTGIVPSDNSQNNLAEIRRLYEQFAGAHNIASTLKHWPTQNNSLTKPHLEMAFRYTERIYDSLAKIGKDSSRGWPKRAFEEGELREVKNNARMVVLNVLDYVDKSQTVKPNSFNHPVVV